jgi:hypothetical protein
MITKDLQRIRRKSFVIMKSRADLSCGTAGASRFLLLSVDGNARVRVRVDKQGQGLRGIGLLVAASA